MAGSGDEPKILWLSQPGATGVDPRRIFRDCFRLDGPYPADGNVSADGAVHLVLLTINRFDSAMETLIRAWDATASSRRVPFCVLSESLDDDEVRRVMEAGADASLFISEPPELLKTKLRALLRLGSRIRSLDGLRRQASRRLAEVSREKSLADELILQLEAKESEIKRQSHEIERLLKEIHGQLLAATNLQLNLLPKIVPDRSKVKLYDRFLPAGALGGDFYDYVPYASGDYDIIIADTSGHGVAAALVSVQVRAVIRTFIADKRAGVEHPGPAEILEHINNFMLETFGGAFFVTMFYLAYDSATASLHYSGAGHTPFLFLPAGNSEPEQYLSRNLPLGLIPKISFTEDIIDWQPGDRVLLYTDGLPEVTDSDGEIFGPDRLTAAVKENFEKRGDDFINMLLEKVDAYSGRKRRYLDDVTIVLMERVE